MMRICIRGAGDIATGIAVRLMRSGMKVIMLDIAQPTAVRRTVSFSEAVRLGKFTVEDLTAYRSESVYEAIRITDGNNAAVMVCPDGSLIESLRPDAIVDAVIAKKNIGTKISDAPIVIGVGPGFTVGIDCHAVVETKRGHYLGRAIYERGKSAAPNTGIPGNICGYTSERVLRAPCDGVFAGHKNIGDIVRAGDIAAYAGGLPVYCTIDGMLRGLLADGVRAVQGMKCGDIDPRGLEADCMTVSDKALAVAGGVLEALLHFRSLA